MNKMMCSVAILATKVTYLQGAINTSVKVTALCIWSAGDGAEKELYDAITKEAKVEAERLYPVAEGHAHEIVARIISSKTIKQFMEI